MQAVCTQWKMLDRSHSRLFLRLFVSQMTGMNPQRILEQAKQRGVPESTFQTLAAAGLNLDSWLSGFASVQSSVLHSVDTIRNHPLLSFKDTTVKVTDALLPQERDGAPPAPATADGGDEHFVSVARTRLPKITVTGLVICPTTGRLDLLTDTDDATRKLVEQQCAEQNAAQQADSSAGKK